MKPFLSALLLLLLPVASSSQIRGDYTKELSLSGAFQHLSSEGSSGSSTALLLSPRLGFFVHGGLEIEPELIMMAGSDIDLVYVLNANVSYNFPVGSGGVPFILAGYGRANTIPFFNVPIVETSFAVGVLNLGAGLKIFLKEDVALRLEYRFQNFSGSEETTNYLGSPYTRNIDYTFHTVQFGFSVLL